MLGYPKERDAGLWSEEMQWREGEEDGVEDEVEEEEASGERRHGRLTKDTWTNKNKGINKDDEAGQKEKGNDESESEGKAQEVPNAKCRVPDYRRPSESESERAVQWLGPQWRRRCVNERERERERVHSSKRDGQSATIISTGRRECKNARETHSQKGGPGN